MLIVTIFLLFYVPFCLCSPSVVIIGAGSSGIAAATRLLQNGITNVTILEAEDRIGGRVYSVKFGKGYVDLGAEWYQGQKDHVVYNIAKDILSNNTSSFSLQIQHHKLKTLDQNFSDNLINVFENLYNEPSNTNVSLGEHLIERYEKTIAGIWKDDQVKLEIAREAIGLFESYVIGDDGAFSWFDVAVNRDYEPSEGNQYLNWNGRGYKTILEILMQKYPNASNALPIDDKILLQKEVTRIFWNSEDQVVIKCSDGSTYSADHVIATVSLGVLKHECDLFEPKLPPNKIQAIQQLGYAAVSKAILHFPQKWWNDSYPGSFFIWDKNDIQKSWMTSFTAIIPIPHDANVLEVWFTGKLVPGVENCSDEALIDGVMNVLERFGLVDQAASIRPDGVIRHNWYTNPHFRGTYSFQTPQTRQGNNSDATVLSTPLTNRDNRFSVLFAGEATHPKRYSTVHGAIESGFREADRLIKLYK